MRNFIIWFAVLLTFFGILIFAPRPKAPTALEVRAENSEFGQQVLKEIAYVKDTRPAPPICFAVRKSPYNKEATLTTVPCESVEHLIHQK